MSVLADLMYGYRTIRALGSDKPLRGALNFGAGFTVADNSGTEATDITVATSGITADGDVSGSLDALVVESVTGVGGVATISAAQVTWGGTGYGTISLVATTTTTTNTANQTLATIAMPQDTTYDVYVRVSARDTAASGGYRGTWADDIFSRRTGTNSGNLERQGSTPTVGNEKSWGTLTSAAVNVAVSSNNILVRGSPGATANVKWNVELVILRNA